MKVRCCVAQSQKNWFDEKKISTSSERQTGQKVYRYPSMAAAACCGRESRERDPRSTLHTIFRKKGIGHTSNRTRA